VLARLLANENISVTQGNYPTAFFDVKKRELGLPNWKEMGKDVYDLLVGHEVGHALETPTNFVEIIGEASIPHGYLNVVEDIRIEKKMLAKYPGLVGNFKRGYKELIYDRNLFEVADKDISLLPFMDRLNLKAKGRDLIDVPFTEEEMPYFTKAMSVETFEDVIAVCKEILAWLKAKKQKQKDENSAPKPSKEQPQKKEKTEMSSDEDDSEDEAAESESDDVLPEITGDPKDEIEDEEEKTESETSSGPATDAEDEDDTEEETSPESKENDVTDEELEEVATDAAFERNQETLVEGSGSAVLQGMNRAQYELLKMDYSALNAARDARIDRLYPYQQVFPVDAWKKFQLESKALVNSMVKEFEMRKAAYRSMRATVSTKGTIDVNKLHSYKYNDQMFKQLTHMADAKSHGMVMLIDYSGSMHPVLSGVIRQTLTLMSFCKRVNIPFQVFAFTSRTSTESERQVFKHNFFKTTNGKSFYDISNLQLLELFSSKMPKSVYEKTCEKVFWRTVNEYIQAPQESLSNTPLNAALMAMHFAIADFRKMYTVQKMNLVVLTDGDSNPPALFHGSDSTFVSKALNKKVVVADKIIELGMKRDDTERLVKSITDMNVKTINYHLIDSRSKHVLNQAFDWENLASETVMTAQKNLKTEGVVVFDNNKGYSRRFLISTKVMNAAADAELEIHGDVNFKQAAKALTKFGNAKQKSRLLSQKFADVIS
jgi:ACT domain-containing protein